jgi:hypothetical protein
MLRLKPVHSSLASFPTSFLQMMLVEKGGKAVKEKGIDVNVYDSASALGRDVASFVQKKYVL